MVAGEKDQLWAVAGSEGWAQAHHEQTSFKLIPSYFDRRALYLTDMAAFVLVI
jgi:hypothetical protein